MAHAARSLFVRIAPCESLTADFCMRAMHKSAGCLLHAGPRVVWVG